MAAADAEDQDRGELIGWRRRIDRLDDQLLDLLNRRAALALDIGRAKRRQAQSIYCPKRELEIIARITEANRGPLDRAAIRRLFERIIEESRRLELGSEPTPGDDRQGE